MTIARNVSGTPDAETVLPAVPGRRTRRSRLATVASAVAVVGLLAVVLLFGRALSSEPTTTTGAAGDTLGVGALRMTAGPLTPRDSVLGTRLCSTVDYRNTGTAPQSVDASYDWKLREPSGDVVSVALFGTDSSLSAGQLAGGRTIRGDVCFDGGAATSGRYVLRFDPMGFSSVRGTWTNELG